MILTQQSLTLKLSILLTMAWVSYQFCYIDGTCPGPAPLQSKTRFQRQQNYTDQIRNIVSENWDYMRWKLFYGSWEDTLNEIQWFANQISTGRPLGFAVKPEIQNFCRIDHINLQNQKSLKANVTVDISPQFAYQTEMPLSQFVEESSLKFMHKFAEYPTAEDGIHGLITCGSKTFALHKYVAEHITGRKKLFSDEIQQMVQNIQDECEVYLPANEVEPWLEKPAGAIPKPHFYPKSKCVKCFAYMLSLLNSFWIYENCGPVMDCAQYGDSLVQQMAQDIIGMDQHCR